MPDLLNMAVARQVFAELNSKGRSLDQKVLAHSCEKLIGQVLPMCIFLQYHLALAYKSLGWEDKANRAMASVFFKSHGNTTIGTSNQVNLNNLDLELPANTIELFPAVQRLMADYEQFRDELSKFNRIATTPDTDFVERARFGDKNAGQFDFWPVSFEQRVERMDRRSPYQIGRRFIV